MKTIRVFLCFVVLSIGFVSSPCLAGQGYVIGDEDVLQVSVWGNPELTVEVPVRPDGMISVPLIGDIKAAGIEPQKLKTRLEEEYANFVKKPTVSVIVKEINSFKVYVIGEGVGSNAQAASVSGVVSLKRNTTLMQLLARLGSLQGADLQNAYLLRDGKRLDNDFYKLMAKRDIAQDIPLKPNDLIIIPDNYEKRIKVVGAVKTPTIIFYREGLTALDAILQAGGFTEFAKPNDVTIMRKDGGSTRSIEARLKDVMHDGDISRDVLLMPGDLVIAGTGIF